MADDTLKSAADAVSPEAQKRADQAEAEKAKSLEAVGRWAADFIERPAPPLPVLLARSVKRNGSEVMVSPDDAWMPAGRLGILASAGGKGKTSLLVHLAGHVAAGADWCGLKVVKPGAVALVLGEEDLNECHRRLRRAWESMPEHERRQAAAQTLVLPLAGTGENRLVQEDPSNRTAIPTLRAEELVAYLTKSAPQDGWSLVVVDPFARFAGMNAETDNASATSTMTVLEGLTKLPGNPTVLVAHHTRKGGKDDGNGSDRVELIRGSSAIKDAARWAAMLEVDLSPDESGNGRAVLRVVKSNYTSMTYGVELTTKYGIPTDGKVRPIRELDAETKPDPKPKARGEGAVANEKRQPDEGTPI